MARGNDVEAPLPDTVGFKEKSMASGGDAIT